MRNFFAPIGTPRLRTLLKNYWRYYRDWRTYNRMPHAETLTRANAYPQLFDRTETTPFDAHYFYQPVWMAQHLAQVRPSYHVDIASQINMVNVLSAFVPIIFVDIRPLVTNLQQLSSLSGSLMALPFADNSVQSLSCLHVIEHIGLGRYGDPLDPQGSQKAVRELARVLAVGGNLYLSTPVGRSRVQFNAHRIHTPQDILAMCPQLILKDFAIVNDQQEFIVDTNPQAYNEAKYACGMFHFTKIVE
jgi:predicted SAM-dependent methyltransferase